MITNEYRTCARQRDALSGTRLPVFGSYVPRLCLPILLPGKMVAAAGEAEVVRTHPDEASCGKSNVLAGRQLVGRSRQVLDAGSDKTPLGHRRPEEDGPAKSATHPFPHVGVAPWPGTAKVVAKGTSAGQAEGRTWDQQGGSETPGIETRRAQWPLKMLLRTWRMLDRIKDENERATEGSVKV